MNRESKPENLDLPEVFGNYRLVERLAVGGMAEIFKAKTEGVEGFEKVLVVKRLHERLSRDDDFIEMMIDEAKIAVRLNHPNIARVFDLGRVGPQYFIAMEYIEGPDLGEVIEYTHRRDERLPLSAILYLGAEASAGLHYAHTRTNEEGRPLEIVHRDVSPPNLMFSLEGEVKIVDFGIAKARERVQNTKHGRIKGKFHYMAPEQSRGGRVDARTDVFSLGMVLYELLTGVNPYEGVPDNEMLKTVRAAEIPPVEHHWPSVDRELDRIVMRALATDPTERHENARALEQELVGYHERNCETFGRRRCSELIRRIWNDFEREAAGRARPDQETDTMTPVDYQADESSLIFDPDKSEGAPSDPPTQPVEQRDANPFEEDEPTKIWQGRDRGGAKTTGDGAGSADGGAPGLGAAGPAVGGEPSSEDQARSGGIEKRELPPPPSDDDAFVPDEPSDEQEEISGAEEPEVTGNRSREARKPEPTSPSRERKRPIATSVKTRVRRLATRLERAGLDRRVQRMLVAAFGVAGVLAGLVAIYATLSSSNEKSISAAAPVQKGANETETRADIRVSTTPSGAEVRLEGEPVGRTPVTLNSLAVGESYGMSISKKGFHEIEKEFLVEGDEPIVVELEPSGGMLTVTTSPEGAKVEVDGEEVGESPVDIDSLELDEPHEVTVEYDGETQTRDVEWKEHEPRSKHLAIALPESEDEPASTEVSNRGAAQGGRHRAGSAGGSSRGGARPPASAAESAGTSAESDESSETPDLDIFDDDSSESDESGRSARGTGLVSVQVKGGWGKVYIDGDLVASETPLIRHELVPGRHNVRVEFPALDRSSESRTLTLEAGDNETVIFEP